MIAAKVFVLSHPKTRFPDVQTCASFRRGSRRLTEGRTSPSTIDRRTGEPNPAARDS
jgi:hypothetical protein